ncbi:uncharacterized protein [Gossypium hirsutum]|uniref:Tf2-1-like SH3-like domain-containing protein n=1 Tax=Gossypium hirsutum TaxID=3635 RepID=A0A1U8J5N2_GOSHI|nr:uncharacterized protein LOC107902217 [Gossypium hirsutum]
MDFVSGLPSTPIKKDSIWVIMDRLTKSAHFIPIWTDCSLQKLAKLYISEIVRLHGADGQSEWVIQIPEDMLWSCCRTPLCWAKLGERQVLGPKLVSETEGKVRLIRDRLKVAFDRQKLYADLKMRDIDYFGGDFIFLKVSPWKKVPRFRRKGKLSLQFVRPYQILKRVGLVAYQLKLPPELNCIHDVFHVSMLMRFQSDPSHIVSIEKIEVKPDLTFKDEPI